MMNHHVMNADVRRKIVNIIMNKQEKISQLIAIQMLQCRSHELHHKRFNMQVVYQTLFPQRLENNLNHLSFKNVLLTWPLLRQIHLTIPLHHKSDRRSNISHHLNPE
ncbi:hypothetical protein BLNAU_12582 [Blattamonas nauphoetae]|uniref:Uncharacterized protein n=1 Tax=Blattamonas nauphoetae TaxID=2049346 RepID=A0ABQ9XJ68_9EUKA|nr:hypothetical protein BLNAU_12582 [Blattamonas nauphoetae]